MYELYPYFTNDGSVGLYSEADNDIYHSTYGALTEAYEKFILPAGLEKFFEKNSEIKILDICFGIGYNSKSFINFFIENTYSDTIYTDNINSLTYNGKIYTDNKSDKKFFNIYIKAIDTDKILAFLSPFVICNKKNLPENYKLPFYNDKISKMLNKPAANYIKYHNSINFLFYEKIVQNYPEILKNSEISEILNSKKYRSFFEADICRLFSLDRKKRSSYTPLRPLFAFLHNIYYRNLSNRYKNDLKAFTNVLFDFDLKLNDARKELLYDNNKYNFIFLDAFTPAKCPALWSLEFFKLLHEHLDENGMILTYSNSAAVRNAFINAGFYVGKTFNSSLKKFTGTVAVKNKSLIKHDLSEYDLGLIKTRAGIFYRDENLTGLNEEILASHRKEVENSNLISSSKYIKEYKKQVEEV